MPKKNDNSEAPTSSRMENSLFTLTKKFLTLLKQTNNKKLDLNYASEKLNVRKRRIYDIVNILHGLNCLRKINTNIIQWIGDDISLILDTDLDKENFMENEGFGMVDGLEHDIMSKIEVLNEKLRNMVIDRENSKYLYVNFGDLSKMPSLMQKIAFAVKAPHDASLECTEEVDKHVLQMNVIDGKFDVFYIEEKKL